MLLADTFGVCRIVSGNCLVLSRGLLSGFFVSSGLLAEDEDDEFGKVFVRPLLDGPNNRARNHWNNFTCALCADYLEAASFAKIKPSPAVIAATCVGISTTASPFSKARTTLAAEMITVRIPVTDVFQFILRILWLTGLAQSALPADLSCHIRVVFDRMPRSQ